MNNTNSNQESQGLSQFHLPPSHPQLISKIPRILPHDRVFPVQIGSELFKLSGASLSSDAPSYFSQYFLCQIKTAEEKGEALCSGIKTLYIDRDPVTFRDISLHLQGYHVAPRDGTHFVRLFADAQFYTLPKLMSQLYESSIFMTIGHEEFQIPRDIFSGPGNSPNFFSLGFAVFFSSPDQIFPGLERDGLIRPPSIMPPSVNGRSAAIFRELLHLLRGYPIHIRDSEHRASLLRDCRYFNFKGLEQKLVPHHISFNQARQRSEMVLRLEDLLKSGISVANDAAPTSSPGYPQGSLDTPPLSGWVQYARPYEDASPHELILEIGGESTRLLRSNSAYANAATVHAPRSGGHQHHPLYQQHQNPFHGSHVEMRAEFFGQTKTRVAKLFEVIATKLNLPPTTQPLGLLMAKGGAGSQPATPGNTPLSEDLVRVVLGEDAYVELDGKVYVASDEATEREGLVGLEDSAGAATTTSASSAGYGEEQDSPMSGMVAGGFGGPQRKRRRLDGLSLGGGLADGPEEWVVRKGQWRLRIQGQRGGKSAVECVLVAVRIEAYSTEGARNAQRGFLA